MRGPMSFRHSCVVILLWVIPAVLSAQEAAAVVVLPVRVHLVRSVMHPRLQATLREAEVRAMFEEVNSIWAPAGVRFEIESFKEVQARAITPKKWFVHDRNWVREAIPTDSFSLDAIDLCFVREMGPNGFFYGEPVVICEQPEFTKVKGGAANPVSRVIAHELGHVLGLKHRQDHTNLMASGRNGVSMNGQEIKDARQRALEIKAAWTRGP